MSEAKPVSGYHDSIGYLRAFLILLVLAHHSVLAYHPFAPPQPHSPHSLAAEPRSWESFPVIDSQRWKGFTMLVGFNDIFFMSLMFFLSGLFVSRSVRRKGKVAFLRDRLLRLGLPFLAAAAIVAPMAYYPSFLQAGAQGGLAGFCHQWLSLGTWPAGPAWFVWVLLLFDCLAVLLLVLLPEFCSAAARVASAASRHLGWSFAILVVISMAVYTPLSLAFGPAQWITFGPFAFQTSRLLHYFVYFLIGIGVGAYGIDRGLLAADGKLARTWFWWVLYALSAFVLEGYVVLSSSRHVSSESRAALGGLTFALSCAASSFAALAVFLRYARSRSPLFDSLRDNSYGMYLIHYAFVTWMQYVLLGASLPAFVKGPMVFLIASTLSWTGVSALRRIPIVARIV